MRAVAALLVGFALAGCLGSDADVVVHATDARALPPGDPDYAGERIRHAVGGFEARLDSARDRGTVTLHVADAGSSYDVVWLSFSGRAPYEQGGVARSERLHGATRNGSAYYPAFTVYVAAWGTANLRVDGILEKDPTTGGATFAARAYVVRGLVRDPGKGVVWNGARTGPYDPAKPDDAFVAATGSQVLVDVLSAAGDVWRHFEFESVRFERL